MKHIWSQGFQIRKCGSVLTQLPLSQPYETGAILQMRKLRVKEPVQDKDKTKLVSLKAEIRTQVVQSLNGLLTIMLCSFFFLHHADG